MTSSSRPIVPSDLLRITCGSLLAFALGVLPAEAQLSDQTVTRPTMDAARIPAGASIDVDGALDDEAWAMATPITEFRQQEPVEGGAPSEPTEIRVLYDDDALYIGAMLFDSDPEGILAHQLERDQGLGTDDRFMWILDTFQDGRTGYFFETNPAGLMGDGLIGGGGGGGGAPTGGRPAAVRWSAWADGRKCSGCSRGRGGSSGRGTTYSWCGATTGRARWRDSSTVSSARSHGDSR